MSFLKLAFSLSFVFLAAPLFASDSGYTESLSSMEVVAAVSSPDFKGASVTSIGRSSDGVREVKIVDNAGNPHTLEVGSSGSSYRKLRDAKKNGTKVDIWTNEEGLITRVKPA